MPDATKTIGTIPMLVLKLAGLGDIADKLNADLADGKITLAEGVDLAEALAPHLEAYLPGQGPVITAAADLLGTAFQCEQMIVPKAEALQAAIKAAAPKPAAPAK
jgi:hypothetical protein